MQLKRTALFMLSAAIILALASPALALDPCSLITQAEAAQILGEAVAAPVTKAVTGVAAGSKCFYRTAAPLAKRGGVGTLEIIVYDPATMQAKGIAFKSPAKYFKRNRQVLAKRGKVQPVDGLPCPAFWLPGANVLHLLAEGHYVQITVRDLTKTQAANRAELDRLLAARRLKLSKQAALQYVLPRLPKK